MRSLVDDLVGGVRAYAPSRFPYAKFGLALAIGIVGSLLPSDDDVSAVVAGAAATKKCADEGSNPVDDSLWRLGLWLLFLNERWRRGWRSCGSGCGGCSCSCGGGGGCCGCGYLQLILVDCFLALAEVDEILHSEWLLSEKGNNLNNNILQSSISAMLMFGAVAMHSDFNH